MPECIEVEQYRAALQSTRGARIVDVDLADPSYSRDGLGRAQLAAAVVGRAVLDTRRRGKLALWDLSRSGASPRADDPLDGSGHPVAAGDAHLTLGLRFGMTGRLAVGDLVPISRLEYSSGRADPSWERVAFVLDDGRRVSVWDQRRLGSVELDPDPDALGPDVWALDLATFDAVLSGSNRPVKARLLDQHAIAGLGNLLADEILWRAGIAPATASASLPGEARRRLFAAVGETLSDLTARGGSHTGDLQPHRRPGGRCPRDGAPLERHVIGGRTTYACARHQAGTG